MSLSDTDSSCWLRRRNNCRQAAFQPVGRRKNNRHPSFNSLGRSPELGRPVTPDAEHNESAGTEQGKVNVSARSPPTDRVACQKHLRRLLNILAEHEKSNLCTSYR